MLTFHPLELRQRTTIAEDAVCLELQAPPGLADAYRFEAGQHLAVRAILGGRELRRTYSIASAAGGTLRIGVRVQGEMSRHLAEGLQPGGHIEALEPAGRFKPTLEPGKAKSYVAIAGGSGITPILSIMKTVLAREPASRFTLIYGNRSQKSTMFKEELEDLKNRCLTRVVLHHVFSREHVESPLAAGRLTRDKIAEFVGPLVDPASIDQAFVCGPHGVNDEAEAALLAAGVPPERIHIERFGVPDGTPVTHEALPGDAPQARITIVRDGLTREIDFRAGDASLLDAAAAAGMDVPYSCKSGVCSTCRAKVVEGAVRMDRNFALEKHEVEAGYVLTCQAHPLTPRVVVSYDER